MSVAIQKEISLLQDADSRLRQHIQRYDAEKAEAYEQISELFQYSDSRDCEISKLREERQTLLEMLVDERLKNIAYFDPEIIIARNNSFDIMDHEEREAKRSIIRRKIEAGLSEGADEGAGQR